MNDGREGEGKKECLQEELEDEADVKEVEALLEDDAEGDEGRLIVIGDDMVY